MKEKISNFIVILWFMIFAFFFASYFWNEPSKVHAELRNEKKITNGYHYEVYMYEKRIGYVIMPTDTLDTLILVKRQW